MRGPPIVSVVVDKIVFETTRAYDRRLMSACIGRGEAIATLNFHDEETGLDF